MPADSIASPRRVLTVSPRMALAAIAAGGMGALWLWWQGQPRDLHTLGGWLTGGGRITGLLASYGIAVQLLLMSRAPALDRGIGTDRLARWHAFSGGYTVSIASRDVFVCGPAGFTKAAGRVLRQAGVPAGRVYVERFQF